MNPFDLPGILAAFALAAVLAAAAPSSVLARQAATAGAEMQGPQVISWGRVEVTAGPELAFEVLTDYDRMADFLPGMLTSEVAARRGHSVVVEQSAEEGMLFFTQRIDVRLAIDESPPRRISIRALAGSFKQLTGTYELTRMDGGTMIDYRARFIPDFRLPAMIGLYAVQRSLERHLAALAAEMERRASHGAARADAGGKPTGER